MVDYEKEASGNAVVSDVREDGSPDNGSDRSRQVDKHAHRGVLDRFIQPTAVVNFQFTLQASWECIAATFQFTLLNGGPASLIYGCLVTGFGATMVAFSLAEMASMDPVIGAQYRWTGAFATRNKDFWSLIQGWLTVFAWIGATAASPAILANITQGLMVFNNPDTYTPERWHNTLLMWLFIIIPVVWNLFFRKVLNVLEIVGGICHVVFLIITVATLGIMAKRSTPEFVFDTLIHDQSGWTDPGMAFTLGLLTAVFPLAGFDGLLHMSDEVKGPNKNIPKGIVAAVTSNAVMMFGFSVCLLFCVGNVKKVAKTPTAMPIIEVYWQATRSVWATNILTLMVFFVLFISLFNIFASVSRLAWAFARDNGLPFSSFFSYVHPTLKIPLRTLLLVAVCCCLLALINIGSTAAFNALLSLPLIAFFVSYFIPIFLLLLRKVRGQHPQYGPFKLGRWGIPINTMALAYCIYLVVFLPFPLILPVDKVNMNYAGPIFGAVVIFAISDWFISGHKRFVVPKPQLTHLDH